VAKKLLLPWDVLLHAWFDLSSDMPPAVVHREFFGRDGAFRAGPQDAEFDRRFGTLARTTGPAEARRLAEEIDRYCFELSRPTERRSRSPTPDRQKCPLKRGNVRPAGRPVRGAAAGGFRP
jgi:hypothetical protein